MNSILETLMEQRRHNAAQAAYLDKVQQELERSERTNNQAIELLAGNQGRTLTENSAPAIPARPPQKATAARNKKSRAAAQKKTPEKAMTAGASS